MTRTFPTAALLTLALIGLTGPIPAAEIVFPDAEWRSRPPADLGLDGPTLDRLGEAPGVTSAAPAA